MEKIRFGGSSIFLYAIIISFVWHIFWLSAVSIVATPKDRGVLKFSTVSFLGPILERGALEVRMKRDQLSFLEKRYLAMVESIARSFEWNKNEAGMNEAQEKNFSVSGDAKLAIYIKEAIGASKLEPAYGIE
ncbi:MAG: hypothetical protein WC779_01175 [Candidatus Omnitrophota bacterium]